MKTLVKYIKYLFHIACISFILNQGIFAQTFQGNIPIVNTDGGGSMIGDIQKSDNHVFVYSSEKITAYTQSGAYAGEVVFNTPEKYRKFNPIYFWDRMYSASTKLMAFNYSTNHPKLYAVAPDLKIYIIDLDENNFLEYETHEPNPIPIPPDPFVPLDSFKPMHGNCILKYDPTHNRLFWVIDAQYESANNTGSHHVRQRYLFIFDVNANSGELTELFSEHEASPGNYSYAGILDIEINQHNDPVEADYFYLSKISALEVWKITKDNPAVIEILHTYSIQNNYNCQYYKTSLQYIYDDQHSIHKIVAYPYWFPGCSYFENPHIFVLDGGHGTSVNWVPTTSPSKKITDIEYLPDMQHIVMSYAANPMTVIPPFGQENDIGIFEFAANSLSLVQELSTDASEAISTIEDFNTPIDIVPVSGSSIMLCKEDEISHVYYDYHDQTYEVQSVLVQENNIFVKGVSFEDNNKFALNATANGIQLTDNSFVPSTFRPHGFQANHICMNSDGSKFYMFNKLNVYDPACYVYDGNTTYNLNNPVFNHVLTAPVGDCIYNPFLDHFLISENAFFTDRAAAVKVFDADDNLIQSIPLSEAGGSNRSHYARKMFIDPNGLLYVLADMNYVQGQGPTLYIFSAIDGSYSLLGRLPVQDMSIPGVEYSFYKAHFCYNQYNNKVYAAINLSLSLMTPYESSDNSIIPSFNGAGLLIEISDHQISASVELAGSGKIIYPDNGTEGPSERYGEKMFVIGTFLHEISPPYNTLNSVNSIPGLAFNDIVYNPEHDLLFALENDQGPNNEHRISKVFTIEYNTTSDQWDKYLVFEQGGQAACLIHNPYDSKIYLHQKMDEHKKGEIPVKLLYFDFDPNAGQQTINSLGTEIICTYPEFDHNPDEIKSLKLYNINTPAINPYNNTIYLPNGGHSSVSLVEFNAEERVLLNEEDSENWIWLSFPRMNRPGNLAMNVNSVIGGNRLDPDYYQFDSQLTFQEYTEDPEALEYPIIFNSFNGTFWDGTQGLLQDVQSTLGYKLNLLYQQPGPDHVWLNMYGSVLDPLTSGDLPTLYTRPNTIIEYFDNWVGYYYYDEQSPFDAISNDNLEHIYAIRGQYWACGKFWGDGIPQPYWVCQCAIGRNVSLKYGDMVVLKTYQEINDFQWQKANSNVVDNLDRPPTQFFSFIEQSDYTPIFIEMDSAVNPVEIGAFVEDSCVGATSVFQQDSIVLVQAYTEGITGDIYFEFHYGSSKSRPEPLRDYLVRSNTEHKRQRRNIHTSEKRDYYLISFKDINAITPAGANSSAWIRCYPNPVRRNATIEFYLTVSGYAEISLYNALGVAQQTLYNGSLSNGKHTIALTAMNTEGRHLANGTYILSLKTAGDQANTKIIIMR